MYNKKEILHNILCVELDILFAFKEVLGSTDSYLGFLELLCSRSYSLQDLPSISRSKMTKLLDLCIPDRPVNSKLDKYLLSLNNLRECKDCSTIKLSSEFRPNLGRSDGKNSYCNTCQMARTKSTQPKRQAQYKAAKLQRIMPWSELPEIAEFYSKCPQEYHVDHIVPLQGDIVSGLHVLENLQYLTAEENIKKKNKFTAGSVVNNPLS